MSPRNEHPLLRTLVVFGASLVGLGCGGKEESDGNASSARLRCPEQCSSRQQLFCDDLAAGTNCRCDANAPLSAEECASPWDFTCQWDTTKGCAPYVDLLPSVSCECAPGRLHPEDCPEPSQFSCTGYGWAVEDCYCDPSAPTGPEDCPERTEYLCFQHNPDVACQCAHINLIK